MAAPERSTEFDHAYQSLVHWFWTDVRIPGQLKTLLVEAQPRQALELGCGLGRYSTWVARQGVRTTGIDFSAVAIAKARAKAASDATPPEFLVGDVTRLDALKGPFDVSFDVGCFHCLERDAQKAYVSEVSRLLKPGGTHLLWALNAAPSGVSLSPSDLRRAFAPAFELTDARKSRRRLVSSHWYWLVREDHT